MPDYVPTTEEVLGMLGSYLYEYGAGCDMNLPGNSPEEIVDRWLAEVERKAAEKALTEAAKAIRHKQHAESIRQMLTKRAAALGLTAGGSDE